MSRRALWVVVLAISIWWVWPRSRTIDVQPVIPGQGIILSADVSFCPMPPIVVSNEPPLQTDAVPKRAFPRLHDSKLTALAGFSVEALVLGRKTYRFGREADFSPLDGWGRMRDGDVLAKLDIRQGGRWYNYRWQDEPPLPVAEIIHSSANMHMVPADASVASALDHIEVGDMVRIDGWLVQIESTDGWRWRSSLTRTDSGAGACELVYVCSVTRY